MTIWVLSLETHTLNWMYLCACARTHTIFPRSGNADSVSLIVYLNCHLRSYRGSWEEVKRSRILFFFFPFVFVNLIFSWKCHRTLNQQPQPITHTHHLFTRHPLLLVSFFFNHLHRKTRGHTHSIVVKLTGHLLSHTESCRERVLCNTTVYCLMHLCMKAFKTCLWVQRKHRLTLSLWAVLLVKCGLCVRGYDWVVDYLCQWKAI